MYTNLSEYIDSILSNLPNSIYWKDKDGFYLGANLYAVRMVGLKNPKDIVGKTDYDFGPKDGADKFRENDLKVINTGKEITVEETSITPNGETLYQLSTKKPLRNKKGEIIGVMGITIDITKRKKQELLLIEKTHSLQEALLEKKRFLNNISHEIRTPLHIIKTIATELYSHFNRCSKEQAKHFLLSIKTQSEKLTKLVHNLLSLTKTQKNQYTYNFKKTNISALIEETVLDFSHIAKINFSNKIKNLYSIVDNIRITQVLRNVLDNAIKYGKNKPIFIQIDNNEEIVITIGNKSIGVPKDEEKKVFEPFFQCSNNLSKAGGTGLGLTICRDILHAHNGDIKLTTDSNNITITTIRLPKYKNEE